MITVRPAVLQDAPAITAIHCSDIVTWKRWDPQGRAHLADYDDLSPHERWLNGGPWMDGTICAVHLERLLAPGSGGLALVAELDGQVRAAAEAVLGEEPPPFGRHLNLSVIYTQRGYARRGLGSALMAALLSTAEREACDTLVVSHAEAASFYAWFGLEHAQTWRRTCLPVRPGQTQYTAEKFEDAGYEAVRGWGMPVGRYQSARQEWEWMRPGAAPDFAEWKRLRVERWRLVARRSPAVLVLAEREAPCAPGTAEVHLWVPPGQALTRQLLAAIRDRAAQSGFAQLNCFAAETALAQLGRDWRDEGYWQQLWLKRLR